jgi:hypothetical protein
MNTETNLQECLAEMCCFVRGGVPGIACLVKVFKNIFLHYDVFLVDDQCAVIRSLGGLSPRTRQQMLKEVGWVEAAPAKKTTTNTTIESYFAGLSEARPAAAEHMHHCGADESAM